MYSFYYPYSIIENAYSQYFRCSNSFLWKDKCVKRLSIAPLSILMLMIESSVTCIVNIHMKRTDYLGTISVKVSHFLCKEAMSGTSCSFLNCLIPSFSLQGCIHVIYLDLSWNKLHYTREEVGLIRKYLPAVKSLNLKHNPWLKVSIQFLSCIYLPLCSKFVFI